jgi:hypothetical protein
MRDNAYDSDHLDAEQADGTDAVGSVDQGPQVSAVMGRASMSLLCENELALQIHPHQPFPPVPPGHRLLAVVVHAADEEGADCARAEAGGIHRHLCVAAWAEQGNAMHHFVQRTRDGGLIETTQETINAGLKLGRNPPLLRPKSGWYGSRRSPWTLPKLPCPVIARRSANTCSRSHNCWPSFA